MRRAPALRQPLAAVHLELLRLTLGGCQLDLVGDVRVAGGQQLQVQVDGTCRISVADEGQCSEQNQGEGDDALHGVLRAHLGLHEASTKAADGIAPLAKAATSGGRVDGLGMRDTLLRASRICKPPRPSLASRRETRSRMSRPYPPLAAIGPT